MIIKFLNLDPITKFVIVIIPLYFLLLIYIQSTFTFIGRGDAPNYSNVARNLLQGRGFVVDYIAFPFIKYDTLTHPEDMWPILQPVWIAISYFFLGVNPFAARVPNAFFLTLTLLTTYFLGKKLFSPRVGLVAFVVTALNTNLIMFTANLITSDIALMFFSLVIAYLSFTIITDRTKQSLHYGPMFLLGIVCGLSILQKSVGMVISGIYFSTILFFYRHRLREFVRPALFYVLAVILITGPFFVRNFILFKSFFLPIEHYMSYIIKYYSYEDIYKVFYNNPPGFKYWTDLGLINFLKINFVYFRYSVDSWIYREPLVPLGILTLAILGTSWVNKIQKIFLIPVLFIFLAFSILLSTFWHFESRYYIFFIPIFGYLAGLSFWKLIEVGNLKSKVIITLLFFLTFLPSLKFIYQEILPKEKDSSLYSFEWINANLPKDTVIMGLTPWEMNFHTLRKTLIIPNESKEGILWFAKKYNATYLELYYLSEIRRETLKDLYLKQSSDQFKLVYDDGKSLIYKINWDAIILDPTTKPDWYTP